MPRLEEKMTFGSEFPVGRAPLVMAVLCLLSLPFLSRPKAIVSGEKSLRVWTFANTHYLDYKARIPLFERSHPGVRVNLQLLPSNELADRLMSGFLSGSGAPELVEVEIGVAGRFFTGGDSDIGFEDLTGRLKSEGWIDKLVAARFTPWSAHGRIYGCPHDLHPVVLLYREDLLKPLGIDLPHEVETWDDFVRVFSRKGVLDLDGDGRNDRSAVMLSDTDTSQFRPLLLQRGGDLFDAKGNVTIDSPVAAETLERYRGFFRDRFALPQPPFGPDLYGPMKENRLYCVVAPDWFVGLIREFAPELAGKWRAMPLPAWSRGGRRTTTMGGTMMAMSKQTSDKGLAWELLKFLYFDKAALVSRYRKTKIIPPLRAAWSDPVFSEPDPYVGGQRLGRLFTSLAPDIPPVSQDQYSSEALTEVGKAIYAAMNNPKLAASEALAVPAKAIRNRIAHDRFRNREAGGPRP